MHNLNFRMDSNSFSKTSQGFLKVKARATRTGVLTYKTSDGITRKEYRPAEEVFKQASINTLKNLSVTVGHPSVKILTPDNYKIFEIGTSGETVDIEVNKWLEINLIIKDPNTIKKVENSELVEISCGYFPLNVEEKTGTFEGENYQFIQRDIVYNHIALLEAKKARSGRDAMILRMDSIDNNNLRLDSFFEEETIKMGKLKIGNAEIEVPDTLIPTLENKFRQDSLDFDNLKKEKETSLSTLQSELDVTKARLDEATEKLKSVPKTDDKIKKTLDILSKANKIEGFDKIKLDSFEDSDIYTKAINLVYPKLDLSKETNDYKKARFDSIIENIEDKTPSVVVSMGNSLKNEQIHLDSVDSTYDPRAKAKKKQDDNYNKSRGMK